MSTQTEILERVLKDLKYYQQYGAKVILETAIFDLEHVIKEPPASKPWVGLSTSDLDEIDAPIRERGSATIAEIYRAIEAKLREKNA